MSAALAIAKSSETYSSERGHALAANDNGHLHLVANTAEGTCHNLSRSSAFLRLTGGGDLTNGQVFTQSLNARLQPEHVRSALNTNVALDMTYTYDPRGKITNVLNAAITGDDRTYSYDALGRLTTATGPWGANHTTGAASYVYDALGNMQSKTVGPRVMNMAYDGQNRLISHTDNIGPARNLTYDSRGNVTQLGGLFFTYDMSDQPTYISGTANGTYKYDGNLKRVKSTVNGKIIYNIYDAGGTLIHIDENPDDPITRKHTDYIGKIARVTTTNPGTVFELVKATYLHSDQLGSANTGTDDLGNVLWREQYTPFGITLTSPLVNNDQAGFTGHIKDSATGLNYMQARYYDPLIGRFLSTDPIGFSPQRPEMFGRYTYVGNDPVNKIDPFGLAAEDPPKVELPKQELKKPENTKNARPSTGDKHADGIKKKIRQEGPTKNKNRYDNSKPADKANKPKNKGTTKQQRKLAKKLAKTLGKYIKIAPIIILPPGSENLGKLPGPVSPQNEGESSNDYCARNPYCI